MSVHRVKGSGAIIRTYSVKLLAGCDHVIHRWKSLLDRGRYGPHRHHIAEVQIAYDGPTHQSTAVVVASQVGDRHERHGVRPRNVTVLVFPTCEHDADVEAEYERQIDRVLIAFAIVHRLFEHPIDAECAPTAIRSSRYELNRYANYQAKLWTTPQVRM